VAEESLLLLRVDVTKSFTPVLTSETTAARDV